MVHMIYHMINVFFEVHVNNIISQTCDHPFQMGFKKGTGLGRSGQGISTPVEAKLRRGKGAIGFYGSERTDRSLKDFPVKPDSDEEDEKQFKEQLQQWKKSDVRPLMILESDFTERIAGS